MTAANQKSVILSHSIIACTALSSIQSHEGPEAYSSGHKVSTAWRGCQYITGQKRDDILQEIFRVFIAKEVRDMFGICFNMIIYFSLFIHSMLIYNK